MAPFTSDIHHLVLGLLSQTPTIFQLELFAAALAVEVQNMVHSDLMLPASLEMQLKPEMKTEDLDDCGRHSQCTGTQGLSNISSHHLIQLTIR